MKTIYELYVIEELELVIAGNAATDYETSTEIRSVLNLIERSEDKEHLKSIIPNNSYRGHKFTILTTYQL